VASRLASKARALIIAPYKMHQTVHGSLGLIKPMANLVQVSFIATGERPEKGIGYEVGDLQEASRCRVREKGHLGKDVNMPDTRA